MSAPRAAIRGVGAGPRQTTNEREGMDLDAQEDRARQEDGPADGALALRVQQGDRDAFALLARRYLRPVHAVAASFLPEQADVEDAAQETFMRALDGIRNFDPDRPFAPWLYQIARNVARNHLRRRARYGVPESDLTETEIPDPGPSPATGAELSELRAQLEAAIRELPEQRRTAFRLADVDGYPPKEVARIMGLTAGGVRAHLHHARRDLRARLTETLNDRN